MEARESLRGKTVLRDLLTTPRGPARYSHADTRVTHEVTDRLG